MYCVERGQARSKALHCDSNIGRATSPVLFNDLVVCSSVSNEQYPRSSCDDLERLFCFGFAV